jgi:rfaE bifunctional protein kinase chain/domain
MQMKLVPLVTQFQEGLQRRRPRVGVIGDSIVDIFEYYRYERPSSEGEDTDVVAQVNVSKAPGGAGNLAANVKGLGGEAHLVSVCGSDIRGDDLRGLLGAGGIVTSLVQDVNRTTSIKRRIYSSTRDNPQRQGLIITLARENRTLISDEIARRVEEFLEKLDVDIVVVSDYARGMITRSLLEAIRRILIGGKGRKVLIDPHPNDSYTKKDLEGFYLVKPNVREVKKFLRLSPDCSRSDLNAEINATCRKFGYKILVTKSDEGMTLHECNDGDKPFHFPALAQKIGSVSGAGDTVMATLALAVALEMDIRDAIRIASAGAAVVVAQPGTTVLQMGELENFATQHDR